jgi:hypothetical protein
MQNKDLFKLKNSHYSQRYNKIVRKRKRQTTAEICNLNQDQIKTKMKEMKIISRMILINKIDDMP